MTDQRPAGASGIVSGVRGRLFAGITMALRRPHERTKIWHGAGWRKHGRTCGAP